MLWSKKYIYLPKYKYVSTNQHGDRFKRSCVKQINVAELSVKACEATPEELKRLILMGNYLNIPVSYEFTEPQHTISIEIVSAQKLRDLFL